MRKLSFEQAVELVQPWVQQANAKPAAPWNDEINLAWKGQFKGAPVWLGVRESADFGLLKGASIVAVAYR